MKGAYFLFGVHLFLTVLVVAQEDEKDYYKRRDVEDYYEKEKRDADDDLYDGLSTDDIDGDTKRKTKRFTSKNEGDDNDDYSKARGKREYDYYSPKRFTREIDFY